MTQKEAHCSRTHEAAIAALATVEALRSSQMAGGSACSGSPAPLSTSFARLASLLSAASIFVAAEAGAAHKVVDPQWHQATATWYGSADGDGSDGKPSLMSVSLLLWSKYIIGHEISRALQVQGFAES